MIVTLFTVHVTLHKIICTVNMHVRHSKTDQFGEGATICLARNDSNLCPVAAILAYIAVRAPTPGPLLMWEDGTPLTKTAFTLKFQAVLVAAGIDPTHYKGHSFRIGAATTAAAVGVPDSTIQMLGRWSSAAFQKYIQTSSADLASIATCLSHATN